MLRIVSGAGAGTGGTQLISSGVTLAHTHTVTAVADHTHTVPAHIHAYDTGPSFNGVLANPSEFSYITDDGFGDLSPAKQDGSLLGTGIPRTAYKTSTTSSGSGITSAAGGHTHTLPSALTDFILAYVDVIQCSKDSAGSPYTYTDYTAEFSWKKLVTYQRLNTLAKNDAYIEFHTTPFASQTFFFMASPPTGWVKITNQHDKALRMVSGGSGGTAGGGAQLLSSVISLAHTHTIGAQADHTHTASHTHPIATGTKTIVIPLGLLGYFVTGISQVTHNLIGGGSGGSQRILNTTTADTADAPAVAGSHDHGGVTDSQLTDITLAYADVILCTKS
jgi:hypothetical protein